MTTHLSTRAMMRAKRFVRMAAMFIHGQISWKCFMGSFHLSTRAVCLKSGGMVFCDRDDEMAFFQECPLDTEPFKNFRTFAGKRPYSEIDKAIKPLVDSLNTIPGVSTIASCEGHFFGGAPYVYFKAPTRVAARIEQVLRTDNTSDTPMLRSQWMLQGLFNEKFELVFHLYSPKYNRYSNNFLCAAWLFVVQRGKVNASLSALATYVRHEYRLSKLEYPLSNNNNFHTVNYD